MDSKTLMETYLMEVGQNGRLDLINTIDNGKLSIIIDFRPKNIIRIALTPLYTSFEDIYSISRRLINIVNEEEYKHKDYSMKGVT